jgi:hypothetical protein
MGIDDCRFQSSRFLSSLLLRAFERVAHGQGFS